MISVAFKDSVEVGQPTKELLSALVITAYIFHIAGYPFTVTSMQDGKHGANSLHYREGRCRAFDVRTRTEAPDYLQWSDDVKNQLKVLVKSALGADYDVVVESTHIHVEYDPK